MPEAGFDRNINLPSSGGKYFRLKAKGDKIRFLIAGTPHYETKHWISESENVLCGRYNGTDKKSPCEWCDKFKDLLAKAGDDKEKVQIANKLKPKTDFFYPVLNLTTDEPVIYQTTQSVHWTIVGYKEEGVDVFKCAWSVERTEEPGKYYEVRRLDAIKLTVEQKETLEEAKGFILNKGISSSSIVNEAEKIMNE